MQVCARISLIWTIALCVTLLSLKSPAWSQTDSEFTPKPATAATRAYLDRVAASLGYQAESGSWRNVYLSGAQELRKGGPNPGTFDASGQTARNLPLGSILMCWRFAWCAIGR